MMHAQVARKRINELTLGKLTDIEQTVENAIEFYVAEGSDEINLDFICDTNYGNIIAAKLRKYGYKLNVSGRKFRAFVPQLDDLTVEESANE